MTRFLVIYFTIVLSATVIAYDLHKTLWEWSYDWISCGESLNRHAGSAAPRDVNEYNKYNDCIFLRIKRWE